MVSFRPLQTDDGTYIKDLKTERLKDWKTWELNKNQLPIWKSPGDNFPLYLSVWDPHPTDIIYGQLLNQYESYICNAYKVL
jgi:hypothetical protein